MRNSSYISIDVAKVSLSYVILGGFGSYMFF